MPSKPDAKTRASSTLGIAQCGRTGHIRRFTRDDLAEARRLLEEAVELDPTNSIAFSDLAIAHHFEAVFGWGEDIARSYNSCGQAARHAIAIDDGDANAHTAMAIFDLFSGRHKDGRHRALRALELDPNSAFARGYLGVNYAFAGDYEAALQHLDEAMRLSPRDPMLVIWHLCKGWAALLSERDGEAVEFTNQAVATNPEFPDNYLVLAAAHGRLGHTGEARAALDQFLQRSPVLTAADERINRPFGTPAQRERFLKGLCLAGLPRA
jgi:adenylate cyclase